MGLKQITPQNRIFFLKYFTTELIDNSIKEERIKKRIEVQKLKQKFVEPLYSKEQSSEKIFKGPIFQPSKYKIKPVDLGLSFSKSKVPKFKDLDKEEREPIIHRMKIPKKRAKKRAIQKLRKLLSFQKKPVSLMRKPIRKSIRIPSRIQALITIQPQAQPRPEGFSLGKLDQLIRDPSIQSVECSGPNKNILVKRYSKTNTTRIILNQSEITDVIDIFSVKAKIPIVGGILKAAVGNLIISAVISEFVGSRFIINKITAYSLIQK